MSKLKLDNLPNKILDEIFSYMSHTQDAFACRLVSRRWNFLATKFWRRLSSTQANISSEKSMVKFLSEMNCRIQEFPFNRIRFKLINFQRLEAVRTLLMNISLFIEEVHIGAIKGQPHNSTQFLSFFNQLDILSLPNLVKLRIDSSFEILTPQKLISLEKLHTLDMPFSTVSMEKISSFLVKSAPNLKLFITSIEYPQNVEDYLIPVWKFGDEYRHITVIQVKLKVHIKISNSLEILTSLIQKLDEWKNIQVTKLKLAIESCHQPGTLFATQVKKSIENKLNVLIQIQADTIRNLEIQVVIVHIKLPVMRNLETLALNFGHHRHICIEPIEGDQFPCLQNVFLYWYVEPCDVFRNAALQNVKKFRVENPSCQTALPDRTELCTAWDKVFPNLESFTYINHYGNDWYNERRFFEHSLSCLRMESLRHVSVYARRYLFNSDEIAGVQNILSGFADFNEVLNGADVAWEAGGEIEEDLYWTKMEELRSPCLTNMPALTSLHLDFAMDDDVAYAVIGSMKPLDKLTIDATYFSEETIEKLSDRHGQVIPFNCCRARDKR